MIFIAPLVSRYADKIEDKRYLVFGGGILAGLALVSFQFLNSFWGVSGIVLAFGISVSISAASRNVLTLNLPVAREAGSSKTMGLYRSVDKLGQALGPLIPATLMALAGLETTMTVMGSGYLLLTLVLVARFKKQ